jgi:predicted nucleic acid-binding Zn ribbon protein
LKRVFNAAGIVFKGSGFYVNDSRKASSSESSAKSEAPKSEAPKSDGGGKGEAAA